MKLVIKEATVAEREWCAHLMAGCDPWITLGRGVDQCRSVCNRPEYVLRVAHKNAAPCGFVLLHPQGLAGSPYVAAIAVAEAWRGQGVGTRLLDHAEAVFAGHARHIFLCVSSFNEGARRLYERHGYAVVGELKDYVVEGASEWLMHKRLAAR
ncbi:MAG: GNAT family N-acetyltransferase [Acidobacteria bacterium]|nr:GNAT family N-acetyltransferase [Acidobacteriota bacterium]